jgi:flagellar motor switch protein FliN
MEKIRIDTVEETISNCIIETFETMLGMDLNKTGLASGTGISDKLLVGIVHFAGEAAGTMRLHVSRQFALQITAAMLGIDESGIDGEDEIKDVLGELTHLIFSSVGSYFVESDLACVISTPCIIHGSDFNIESDKMSALHRWIFRHKQHEVIVEITLKENIGAKPEIAGIDRLDSAAAAAKINCVDVPAGIVNSVTGVFHSLLAMQIENIACVTPGYRESRRSAGTISFAGDVNGLFTIQVSDEFGRTMAAAMLGISEDEIESEEEVYDVLRELCNIIGNHFISNFVDIGLPCMLSAPEVIHGSDFRVEALDIVQARRFFFSFGSNTIIVDAGIKKEASEKAEAGQKRSPTLSEEKKTSDDELRNLNLIKAIPLELTVQMGGTQTRINDLLKLGSDSIVELDQLEGEPVDLLVNETLIAKGEVVVEKEKYGIRIVEIVSRKERVKSLR